MDSDPCCTPAPWWRPGRRGPCFSANVPQTRGATPASGRYPGGTVEADESPLEAALRALDGELRIDLGPHAAIGWPDDYPTLSGYVITPLVLCGGGDPVLRPAHDEVSKVYRVSLQALVNSQPRFIAIPESRHPVLQLPLDADPRSHRRRPLPTEAGRLLRRGWRAARTTSSSPYSPGPKATDHRDQPSLRLPCSAATTHTRRSRFAIGPANPGRVQPSAVACRRGCFVKGSCPGPRRRFRYAAELH